MPARMGSNSKLRTSHKPISQLTRQLIGQSYRSLNTLSFFVGARDTRSSCAPPSTPSLQLPTSPLHLTQPASTTTAHTHPSPCPPTPSTLSPFSPLHIRAALGAPSCPHPVPPLPPTPTSLPNAPTPTPTPPQIRAALGAPLMRPNLQEARSQQALLAARALARLAGEPRR